MRTRTLLWLGAFGFLFCFLVFLVFVFQVLCLRESLTHSGESENSGSGRVLLLTVVSKKLLYLLEPQFAKCESKEKKMSLMGSSGRF